MDRQDRGDGEIGVMEALRRASPANFASLVRVPLRFAKGRGGLNRRLIL